MTRVLVVHSATLGTNSVSRLLIDDALAALKRGGRTPQVTVRDLAETPIPHADATWAAVHHTKPGEDWPGYKEATRLSDQLIGEMKEAELILLGCPMYQASIPSSLKAWIDRVLLNGQTIKMSPAGREGLLAGRRILSILSRGGVHSPEAGGDGMDFQKPYLDLIFGLMGLERDYILAEGMASPVFRDKNLSAAKEKVAAHPWLTA